ncbi:MAG TPA: hypothetical protein VF584_00485 [Longimicrobium sp.]
MPKIGILTIHGMGEQEEDFDGNGSLTRRRRDAGENCDCMAHTETQSHRENPQKVFSVAFSSFCGLCVRLFSVVLSLRLCASA